MSSPSRAAQFTKLHKVLKKYYTPVEPDPNRPVLEQLLYGCLLENAHYAAAEEANAALIHGFFDWNEIRVSTVRELAEAMHGLPDPPAAANRIKRVLQNVFEATYAFDLEELRKLNLGAAVERMKKIDGASEFAVCYVVQAALGGHSIPIDSGTARALYTIDLISEQDVKKETAPGLERAIPKSKGAEFGSLLHQLGADYVADPYSSGLREILLQIDAIATERLPKRRQRKAAEQAASPAEKATEKGKSAEKKKKPSEAAAPELKPSTEATVPSKAESAAKRDSRVQEETEAAKKKPAATKKRPTDKPVEKSAEKPAEKAAKASEKGQEKSAEKKKPAATSKSKPESDTGKLRVETAEIAKRKPR